MNAIAYCNPFVPPEWIAAHGLRPCWRRAPTGDEPAVWVRRGVCPVAAARLDEFSGKLPAGTMHGHHVPMVGSERADWSAVVLTTTCDQIRYAAALLQDRGMLPVFLLHVPRTRTAAVRAFYGEELSRMGRFLVNCGGTSPTGDALSQTMLRYDRARASLRLRREAMSAGAYAQAVAAVRGHLVESGEHPGCEQGELQIANCSLQSANSRHGIPNLQFAICNLQSLPSPPTMGTCCPPAPCLPLALTGGPMSRGDYELLTVVEDAGGRFVLDATESGERTLPAPVDIDRLEADPREELVRIYFDSIPDVFQRPNDRLFAWLRREVAQRHVRGILVRRYVWCDHWHGEMPRLRQELAVPLLEWDGAGNDSRARASAIARMEAFLEMLR